MSNAAKALRKLGCGDAAVKLLSPLCSDKTPLPTREEAMAYLASVSPDEGRSALRDNPLAFNKTEYTLCVIIPVYNAEAWLEGCLDSVFSQACSYPLQVVAVDDGSVDGSPAILDAWRERGLEVIRQENAGAAAARNRALECCRAEYVLFLDADDALVPGCLEPAIRLAREEDADLVECAYTTVDAEGRPMRVFSHPEGPMSPRDCTGFPHGKLFRARLFTRLGFPAGYLFEDSVLAQLVYPLLEQSGGKSLGLNRQMLYYRVHAANTSHKNLVRPKSIDSLWITLSLFRDRQTLGLVADARYYEYLLNMLVLTMHRTERLGDEVRRAEFAVFRELLGELSGFSTGRPAWRALESAVAAGDYGKARLFCSLH